jgi:hypothetical protein
MENPWYVGNNFNEALESMLEAEKVIDGYSA